MSTSQDWHWFWEGPPWHWAYGWAAATLFVPTLVAVAVRISPSNKKPRPVIDLLAGVDGRWSTSKTSFVLWTAAVCWALLAILFHNKGIGTTGLEAHAGAYALLLGIPAAAASRGQGDYGVEDVCGHCAADQGESRAGGKPGKGSRPARHRRRGTR